MAHVLIVVARKYNGHEFWTALGVLSDRGHTYTVVSTDKIIADEINLNHQTRIEHTLDEDVAPMLKDALMIISGNMADTERNWYHPKVLNLVERANEAGMPIAAICCSVPAIRGAAKDKRVSFFPLVRSKDLLTRAGAIPAGTVMTRDQNLVTAEHQMATEYWAEEFCNLLEGKPPEHVFTLTSFKAPGFPAKLPAGIEKIGPVMEMKKKKVNK